MMLFVRRGLGCLGVISCSLMRLTIWVLSDPSFRTTYLLFAQAFATM